MDIAFRRITKDNFEQIAELHIPEEQQQYLSENIWSIAESRFHDTHDARGIYLKDEPVGFIMWVRMSESKTSIWRFMIAHEHQNRGIGRLALSKAIDEIKTIAGTQTIEICYGPENDLAKNLYFSLGFKETEVTDDGHEAYAVISLT